MPYEQLPFTIKWLFFCYKISVRACFFEKLMFIDKVDDEIKLHVVFNF